MSGAANTIGPAGLGRLLRHTAFCLRDPAGLGGTYAYRERFNHALFISPKHDFLFAKNEKCGSNSARMTLQSVAAGRTLPKTFKDTNRWFAPLLQPSDLGLRDIRQINALVPLKFAVVRNPYSRALSCYLDKFSPDNPKLERFARRAGGSGAMSFGEFIEHVSRQQPFEMDPHWRVQARNIYCDIIDYDRFVYFEALEEEFGAILARIGTGANLWTVHKGHRNAGRRIAEFYTPQIAKLVRDTYAEDFERFGYSAELPE